VTKRKARPRPLKLSSALDQFDRWAIDDEYGTYFVWNGIPPETGADCRRLAAWLIKAADWLEWKEKHGND